MASPTTITWKAPPTPNLLEVDVNVTPSNNNKTVSEEVAFSTTSYDLSDFNFPDGTKIHYEVVATYRTIIDVPPILGSGVTYQYVVLTSGDMVLAQPKPPLNLKFQFFPLTVIFSGLQDDPSFYLNASSFNGTYEVAFDLNANMATMSLGTTDVVTEGNTVSATLNVSSALDVSINTGEETFEALFAGHVSVLGGSVTNSYDNVGGSVSVAASEN